MMHLRKLWILPLLACVACGSPVDNKSKSRGAPSNNTSSNNTSSNNTTSNNTTGGGSCGDGVLDAGELCDPAKTDGPGVCPQSCEAPACATATLAGSAAACTAQCIVEPVACASGDGCCPAGCDSATDSDCTNQCGDSVVEGPETCDGNCPTTCADQDACTMDTLTGSAAQCNAVCSFTPVTVCASGDGCCPASCTSDNDDDCEPVVTCGNGTVDAGELCDGNCPSSCNDGIACTTDALTGSAATCNAQCTATPITACVNGDGCCPTGCTFQNDNDCVCVPKTCAELGAECGMIADGCGGTLTCTDTCTSIEVCSQNQCVPENFIGHDCNDFPDCGASLDAACILPPDWPGGYCSIICNSQNGNTLCPSGSHCADFDGVNSLCLLNCTSSAQCEAGYVCRQWDGTGGSECVPPEPPPGTGMLGDACGSDNDCSGALICQQSVTLQSVVTTFPGGVCTEACTPLLGQCSDMVSICTLEGLCMEPCNTAADCRVGWQCMVSIFPTAVSYCWPN